MKILIFDTVDDLVSDLLYYDRKETTEMKCPKCDGETVPIAHCPECKRLDVVPKSADIFRRVDELVSRQDIESVEQFVEFFERYGDFNLQAIVDQNEAHFSLEDLYQSFKNRLFADIGFERGRGDQKF